MKKPDTGKVLIISGHIVFLLLLLLSIIFYKERILFFDDVLYLFRIVHFEKMCLAIGRYGAFITQIPVLMALQAGLPLKLLMLIYSVTFILLYYSVYIICIHGFRNKAAGLGIVFILVLCMKQTFYHTMHESHQALVYSVLFYASINHNFRKKYLFVKYATGALLIILCFITYPTVLILLLFLVGYYIIEHSAWNEKGNYFMMAFLILLALFKITHTGQSSYEGQFLSGLISTKSGIRDIGNFYSTGFFIKRIGSIYFWMTILFCISVVLQISKRKYFSAAYTVISAFGYLGLVLLTFRNGDSDVMMERGFLPLTVFVSIPFLIELFSIKSRSILITGVLLVIIIQFAGLRRIDLEGYKFRTRVDFIEQLLNDTRSKEGRKFMLKNSYEVKSNTIMSWPFPFTTIVLSSMQGNTDSRTIFLYDDLRPYKKYLTGESHIMLGPDFWPKIRTDRLNHQYFNLPDGPYHILVIGEKAFEN
jgi:hypothetical protein